jgi:CheY-like chemotaxis protein
MNIRLTSAFPVIRDEIAEGAPETGEFKEPANPVQTTSSPVIKTWGNYAPSAETGVVPAVVIAGFEGQDNADLQDASRTTAETQVAPLNQKATQTMTERMPSVLIVEDTTELAEVIQATLERMNMRTAHETHGSKALLRFDDIKPDVVLLDIGLPDMTGWKFLEAVKEKHRDRMPIIIVITAYGDPANRLVAKFQDVHEYLIKPFTSDEVERVVMSALRSKTA